jgi:hypothetical protein
MKHLKKFEKLYINHTLDYDLDDYVYVIYNKYTDLGWADLKKITMKH